MSAISLGALLFDFINWYLPDAALQSYRCSGSYCGNSIRWEMAILIIAFPILVWAWRFLQKDIAGNPLKADIRVRKWLLYFTLFVAGVVVMGDLIAVLYSWLQGELTRQFLLKILSVLMIAGSIFYYFLRELHPEKPGQQKIVGLLSCALVFLTIVAGFSTVGLPVSAHAIRVDERRVSDLQGLNNQIYQYWLAKRVLPVSLNDLQATIPVDPETHQAYEYSTKGSLEYALCAIFKTSVTDKNRNGLYNYPSQVNGIKSWDHGVGRVCFSGVIDPDYAPAYPQKFQ